MLFSAWHYDVHDDHDDGNVNDDDDDDENYVKDNDDDPSRQALVPHLVLMNQGHDGHEWW